jgi:hypothetical protein
MLYDFYHDVLKTKCIAPNRLYKGLDARFRCSLSLEDFISSLLGHREDFKRQLENNCTIEHKVTVFVTEKQDTGFTWLDSTFEIRADDQLVALFGFQMPFILRLFQRDSTHRIVNLAYVSGRSDEFCERYNDAWYRAAIGEARDQRLEDDQRGWVGNAAEGCPEYAII